MKRADIPEIASKIGTRAYFNLTQAAVDLRRDTTISSRLIAAAAEEVLSFHAEDRLQATPEEISERKAL